MDWAALASQGHRAAKLRQAAIVPQPRHRNGYGAFARWERGTFATLRRAWQIGTGATHCGAANKFSGQCAPGGPLQRRSIF